MMVLLPVVFSQDGNSLFQMLQQYTYAIIDPLLISGGFQEMKIMEVLKFKCADTSNIFPGAAYIL